jgi:putative flippase GtrA
MGAGRFADRYAAFWVAVCARLHLPRLVSPTFLGFCFINGCTFALDLLIVTVVHGRLGAPVPVAVTVGYAIAFSLSFGLNKVLNFRSHDPVGPEGARYVLVVAINFTVLLLGVTSLLSALGVQYQVARLVAGGCEGVFMYAAMRWFVFKEAADREPELTPR